MYMNVISPNGFRKDGRTPSQVRTLKCCIGRNTLDYTTLTSSDNGAAILEHGETKVIAQVLDDTSFRHEGAFTSSLMCEITWSPFASAERRVRKSTDRLSTAYATTIQSIFDPLLITSSRQRIDLQITVLSMDGGVLAACINAATMALIRAGVQLQDLVVATCVAQINEQTFLDPTSAEILQGEADLTLALCYASQTISALLCDSKITSEALNKMVSEAIIACNQHMTTIKTAFQDHVERLALSSQILSERVHASLSKQAQVADRR